MSPRASIGVRVWRDGREPVRHQAMENGEAIGPEVDTFAEADRLATHAFAVAEGPAELYTWTPGHGYIIRDVRG